MATDDDMRERIQRLESKFDGLEKKIDQLPTKKDFEGMTNKVSILVGEAKDAAKMAAEGYKATLDRIERDLGELNKKVSVQLSDHDIPLFLRDEAARPAARSASVLYGACPLAVPDLTRLIHADDDAIVRMSAQEAEIAIWSARGLHALIPRPGSSPPSRRCFVPGNPTVATMPRRGAHQGPRCASTRQPPTRRADRRSGLPLRETAGSTTSGRPRRPQTTPLPTGTAGPSGAVANRAVAHEVHTGQSA